MANFIARFLFFLSITCSAFCYGSDAEAITYNFPPQTNIQLSADASIFKDLIQLTETNVNANVTSSLGWATYPNIIPFQALASFSTHFQFSINRGFGKDLDNTDGLTFFLAPFDLKSSDVDAGRFLGLVNKREDGNSFNNIVAVEFDTSKNEFDPDDNHVGIGVNSVYSRVTFSVSDLYEDAALNSGEKWEAWVDYNGTHIQVFLSYNPNHTSPSKPESPVLVYPTNLSQILSPNVKVGFSASTGNPYQTHSLHFGTFSYQYSLLTRSPTQTLNTPTPHSYNPPISNPNTLTPPSYNPKKNSLMNIIIIVISVVILCIIIIIIIITWCVIERQVHGGEGEEELERGGEREENDEELDKWLAKAAHSARKFSYVELSAATNNFNDEEKIGYGGFGTVYRGTLCSTNEAVAVKRISTTSKQGKKEYEAEVVINSILSHRNLVKLLGWCHQKDDRLLVYEFLHNKSLDKYIFGKPECHLDWDKRYRIASDIASALFYLHDHNPKNVLHRDIKATNVMLDSNFRAKMGDFGLARALNPEKEGHTIVPAGTIGYMPLEYVRMGRATRESDVFGFGTLALEIACGRQPVDSSLSQHNYRVVEWVWDLYGKQKIVDVADEKLGGNFNVEDMKWLMLVGLWCSHPDPKARPRMKQVLDTLEREAELPPIPPYYPYVDPPPPQVGSWSIGASDRRIAGVSFTFCHVNATV